MQDIVNEYLKLNCSRCNNKKSKIEEDKCELHIYEYNGYKYCKCSNMSDNCKELKKKII